MRYKLYTNVSDFTGNRTVPSMDNSTRTRTVTPRVPSPTVPYSKIRVLVRVLQSTIPTVLLNLLRYLQYCGFHYLLPTTYYLLPATTYYLLPGYYLQYYLLPTAYCLLPATCYLLPTTYYLLPTTYYLIPNTSRLYCLLRVPTTCYLLPATCC